MFGDVYGDLPDVSESQQTEAGNTGAASANGNKNVSGVSQNSSNDNDDRAPPLPVVEAELTPKRHPRNPIVFLDVSIGGLAGGRIYIELYAHAAPLTAENFRCLCTGEKGSVTTRDGEKQLCYRGSKFHRIVQEFVLQGGDITKNTGQGGYSIYGRTFHDENFVVKHTRRGLLSMANAGRNTNGSQFFITLRDLKHLDGKHTVFGEVLFGHKIVTKIEDVGRPNGSGTPTKEVCITNCGQIRSNSTRGSTKKVKRRRSAGSDGEPSHKNTDAATSPKAGASSPPKPKVARHAGSSAPSVGEVCVKLSKFFAKDKKVPTCCRLLKDLVSKHLAEFASPDSASAAAAAAATDAPQAADSTINSNDSAGSSSVECGDISSENPNGRHIANVLEAAFSDPARFDASYPHYEILRSMLETVLVRRRRLPADFQGRLNEFAKNLNL